MPEFLVEYSFNGMGKVKIEAESKEEAVEMFMDGNFDNEKDEEWGEDYVIEAVKTPLFFCKKCEEKTDNIDDIDGYCSTCTD